MKPYQPTSWVYKIKVVPPFSPVLSSKEHYYFIARSIGEAENTLLTALPDTHIVSITRIGVHGIESTDI